MRVPGDLPVGQLASKDSNTAENGCLASNALSASWNILAVAHRMRQTIPATLRDSEPDLHPWIDFRGLVMHRNAAG